MSSGPPPFDQLPDIRYVPKEWTEAERQDWLLLEHFERLTCLDASSDPAMDYDDNSMPIEVIFYREETHRMLIPTSILSPKTLLLIVPNCYAETKESSVSGLDTLLYLITV